MCTTQLTQHIVQAMARAITGEQLTKAVEEQTFIKGGEAQCAEGIKYDFRMGSNILKASYGQPVNITSLSGTERSNMFVEPGEVVFTLTEETLALPVNMMAQLMPKRKLSHQGIMVLGGFCVDPLYSGRLLVGLYNFSSTRFPLRPGKKLIAAVFFELETSELGTFAAPESSVNDFPDELITLIQNYKPVALQGLQDLVGDLQIQLNTLRNDIVSDREWQREFKESLKSHDEQIGRLLEGLVEEKDNRLAAEQSLRDQLKEIQFQTWKNSWRLVVITAAIVALISMAIQFAIQYLTKKP